MTCIYVHTEPDTVWLPLSSIVGGGIKSYQSKPCKNLFYEHIVNSKNVQMY